MNRAGWLALGVCAASLVAGGTSVFAAGSARGRGMGMRPAPVPRIIIGKRDGLHAQMIKKFDKNGDGRLDEQERQAAKEAAQHNPKMTHKK
jgi:hypothetical protein